MTMLTGILYKGTILFNGDGDSRRVEVLFLLFVIALLIIIEGKLCE